MSKEQVTLEQRALNGLANFIIMHGNNDDYDASAIEWHGILKIALNELESWRDELNETIQDLISKAKHWEEKENKTDFEKGIARGYKTMLHQLSVGIDLDKESD